MEEIEDGYSWIYYIAITDLPEVRGDEFIRSIQSIINDRNAKGKCFLTPDA